MPRSTDRSESVVRPASAELAWQQAWEAASPSSDGGRRSVGSQGQQGIEQASLSAR